MKRKIIRTALLVLFAMMLLGGVAVFVPPMERASQHRRVEAAISRFQASPSEQQAQELIGLLDRQVATPEQGQRILKMLLYPDVATHSSYPLGQPPTFSVTRRFEIRFPGSSVSGGASLWVEGKNQDGYSGSGIGHFGPPPVIYGLNPIPEGREFYFDTIPQIFTLRRNPKEIGVYGAEVRYEFAVTPQVRKTTWSWKPWRGPFPRSFLPRRRTAWSIIPGSEPLYACQFAVPVELTVVEADRAENIQLLSDPQLDAKMRNAFAAGPGNMTGTYSTPDGWRDFTGSLQINCGPLPVAVAFGTMLRLANGDVIAPRNANFERIRIRAHAFGSIHPNIGAFQLQEPGQYNATLILKPDPDYAYQDPEIKAIWNGTLEFPISFSVQKMSRP